MSKIKIFLIIANIFVGFAIYLSSELYFALILFIDTFCAPIDVVKVLS